MTNILLVASAMLLGLTTFAPHDASASDPVPIGNEFLAAGRTLEGERFDYQQCFDAAGNSYRLIQTTSNPTDPTREVRVERKDPDGNLLDPIVLDPKFWPMQIWCSRGGKILVDLYLIDSDQVGEFQLYGPDGQAAGQFQRGPGYSWSDFELHDSAGIFEVREVVESDEWKLVGRWIDWNGEPRSEYVELARDASVWAGVDAATDEAGHVLVSWVRVLNPDYGYGRGPVEAQIVDAEGAAIGSALVLSQGEGVWPWGEPQAFEEQTGIFAVYWVDEKQGGLVGRRVSVDPDAFPGEVTTTTLPGEVDPLGFGPERELGRVSMRVSNRYLHELASDGIGTWLAGWWQAEWDPQSGDYDYARYTVARSVDNGAHWSLDDDLQLSGDGVSIAMDTTGTAVLAGENADGLTLRISDDAGAEWPRTVFIPRSPEDGDQAGFTGEEANTSVATDGSGVWGVSWSVYDYDPVTRSGQSVVYVAMSNDDGLTWQPPRRLAELPIERNVRLKLAAGAGNAWILAWQRVDRNTIHTARSTDDGASWNPPAELVRVEGSVSPWATWQGIDPTWPGSLDLDCVAGSQWILTFASGAFDSEQYGPDGDIFSMRSTDDGATWTTPEPVNSFARVDGARDERPAIATNGSGQVMIAWKSHDSLGATLETDADIVRATSTDAGVTWSRPAPVNAGAESDTSHEGFPRLAAGPNGTWLAAWRTYVPSTDDPADPAWRQEHELMVGAAPSNCGDGMVDAAESCDDGNVDAGDGCDPNCTETSCANGFLTDGEECDDGNPQSDDECVDGCRLAACGDGFLFPFGEQCDDAATSFNGSCLPTCEWAFCGDGYVETADEDCDDGNTIETDACRGYCEAARCGDGVVRQGEEDCDDANTSNYDGCVNGCRPAACGDGHVQLGVEQCDPGRASIFRPCQSDCRLVESCGAGAKAVVTATGALTVLRFAVGLETECSVASCDINRSGQVTVLDAQITLKMAVGGLDASYCRETVTVTLSLDESRGLGGLQFDVQFPAELGSFVDADGDTDCRKSFPHGLFVSNATEPGVLRAAAISVEESSGSIELLSCTFHYSSRVVPLLTDFTVQTVEAFDGDGIELVPAPRIELQMH